MTPGEFISQYWDDARRAGASTGIDPRIILAQAGIETGWGAHVVGNNLFGIKARQGVASVVAWTTEVVNGVATRVRAAFQAFPTRDASFDGYADFINRNPRYQRVIHAGDATAQIRAMAASGYASGGYGNLQSAFNTVSAQVGNGSGGFDPPGTWGITIDGIGTLGSPSTTEPDWWNHPDQQSAIMGDITGGLSSLFNAAIGTRFVAVFIGIVLIGLAIAAFVLTSDNSGSIGKAIPNVS